jgi:hypothetical protein
MLRRDFAPVMMGAALVLVGSRMESGEMNRVELDGLVAALFAADAADEYQAALAVVEAASAAGTPAEARLLAVNHAGRMTAAAHAVHPQAIATILVDGEVYLWRPKDPASLGAFFLE